MELPGGRSVPAGDPRAQEPNPYVDEHAYVYKHSARTGSIADQEFHRAYADNAYSRPRRTGPFFPHRPSRVQIDENPPGLTDEQLEAFAETGSNATRRAEHSDYDIHYRGVLVRNQMRKRNKAAAEADQERIRAQAEQSYYEGKRQRRFGIMNHFVGQNVPAQPPFKRSFIPHDLAHLLSPDD